MAKNASVVLLEFNELTPRLIDQFIANGKLANFDRFRRESHVYTTDAEEEGERLNPWVQWVTVHTGLSPEEHGIIHLDDGHKLNTKCIWEVLSDANLTVWVCGSMNVHHEDGINGCILPDPWTSVVAPYPAVLDTYYKFIKVNVQEHTRDRVPLGVRDHLRFLNFMVRHGISAKTISAIVRQLMRERGGKFKWKRVAIMDRLQWDVFRWYYRKLKPDFSTFFLNSTAHLQHKYWRNMSPSLFDLKPSRKEQGEYQSAVPFGYEAMDTLLGEFMKLAGDKTTLIFCTGLSQQECTIYDASGGKHFYRPYDIEQVLKFAGVTAALSCAPVMSEQFHVRFQNERDARAAEGRLKALKVGERPVFGVERTEDGLFIGCTLFDDVDREAVLFVDGSGNSSAFFDIFYRADSTKSGMHHPDGMLWIRTSERGHSVHREKVSLRSVAPTILNMLRVPQPDFMSGTPLLDTQDHSRREDRHTS